MSQKHYKPSLVPPMLSLSLVAIAVAACFVSEPEAATINVTGGCTLIEAINSANSDSAIGGCATGAGSDTIVLQASSSHHLATVDNTSTAGANGLPVINSDMTIEAQFDNAYIFRLSAANFRIFEVGSGAELTLNNIFVSGGSAVAAIPGYAQGLGGGILAQGTVTLNNSTVRVNTAERRGGGISLIGTGKLEINDSLITLNQAEGGGGIDKTGGSMTLINTTVSSNTVTGSGGGISSFGKFTSLSNCVVTENVASYAGGLQLSRSSTYGDTGISILVGTSVTANTATAYAGGIMSFQTVTTILGSTVSGNAATGGNAGGIANRDSTVSLVNSTVSNNGASANGGGVYSFGVYNYENGVTNISNSTISGNTAAGIAGGVHSAYFSTSTIVNSTIVANRALKPGNGLNGQNIYTYPYAATNISHSIVSGSGTDDCSATGNVSINDLGNNWFEDNSCNGTAQGDPKLGSLADNGGLSKTHALLSGSGAIDAVNVTNCVGSGLQPFDQRGVERPQGAACDIGSYEFEESTTFFVIPTANGKTVIIGL